MKIGLIGDKLSLEEIQAKFDGHEIAFIKIEEIPALQESLDFVFHFTFEENPDDLELISRCPGPVFFLNTVKTSLAEVSFLHGELNDNVFGFNGLPGFLDRPLLEVTSMGSPDGLLDNLVKINFEYQLVSDRVGMVTPRIICMIINEAFYTFQEGTASKEDINLGMKLGTNYPYGPFEWLEIIGIQEVYELLEALYDDTKDSRYKVCPLLKRDYLLAKN
ncbi:MAG: 3-hydroxyacyl-CoA dehydrogenase family protein [Bacteroidota bacterium]